MITKGSKVEIIGKSLTGFVKEINRSFYYVYNGEGEYLGSYMEVELKELPDTEGTITVSMKEQYEKVLSEREDLQEQLDALQAENEWISVEDELPYELSLLLWRPIDHKERPFHEEVIVGKMACNSHTQVWSNGRLYDVKTHITHWRALPTPPKAKD